MNKEQRIFASLKDSFSPNGTLLYAGTLLQRAYQTFPDNIALITNQKNITYRELYIRSRLFENVLAKHNIQPRDRVLLFYENSPEFYIAYFAIWQRGAVVVPLNVFLHEKELTYIINDAQPKAIITSPTLKSKLDRLTLPNGIACLPPLITNENFDWETPITNELEQTIQSMPITTLSSKELCVLLYTSGTTGFPKGVMISSTNVITNALQAYARFSIMGMTSAERFFCVLPLFHVFAQNTCLWLPAMIGSSVIIVAQIDRKLIFEGLKRKPTLFFGVPALYGLLCLLRTAPLDSVKFFVSGADMLPDKIRSAFSIIYGRRICAGYGLTETSPIVAANHENDIAPTTNVGFPLTGIESDIRDENGSSSPQGTIGELWLKGDNVMIGYYNAPENTSRVLVNGWINTGDLAFKDKDGRLAICGRTKDVIIHKGFNIYPAEIENVLLLHPAVFKAAVVGHDDDTSGQIPVAFVAVKSKNTNLEASLRELCSNNLAVYKIPRKFVCLEDLPTNATGKVDKKQLRSQPLSSNM